MISRFGQTLVATCHECGVVVNSTIGQELDDFVSCLELCGWDVSGFEGSVVFLILCPKCRGVG